MAFPYANSTAVVNSALEQVAAQTQISTLTDGTPAANAAQVVYIPTVQLLLRELDPDFAQYTAALTLSGVATPVVPWAYEYLAPTDMVRLRQIKPNTSAVNYDPSPIRAQVAFDIIATINTKVILTNQAGALAVYTSSSVAEAQWDAAFADAVVRRLANPLAMALAGRPDFAKEILMQSAQMAQTAASIDDSGFRRAL